MDATYKLDWNVLKEGSVIKFNGETNLFRVWSLNTDGTAEIIPIVRSQVSGIDKWYNANASFIAGNATKTRVATSGGKYYDALLPMSGAGYQSYLTNAPFYNYLVNVNFPATIFWTTSGSGTPTITLTNAPLGYINKIYSTGIASDAPTTQYKWRPMTLTDLSAKFGSEINLRDLKTCFYYAGTKPAYTIDWPSFNMPDASPNTYSSDDVKYYSVDSYDNDKCTIDLAEREIGLPIFKLNLLDCKSIWTLQKE